MNHAVAAAAFFCAVVACSTYRFLFNDPAVPMLLRIVLALSCLMQVAGAYIAARTLMSANPQRKEV